MVVVVVAEVEVMETEVLEATMMVKLWWWSWW